MLDSTMDKGERYGGDHAHREAIPVEALLVWGITVLALILLGEAIAVFSGESPARTLLIGGVGLAAAIWLALVVILRTRFVRPLIEIERALGALVEGDDRPEIAVRRGGVFGRIAGRARQARTHRRETPPA